MKLNRVRHVIVCAISETIISIFCMAQPLVTFPTEPSGGDAAMDDISV